MSNETEQIYRLQQQAARLERTVAFLLNHLALEYHDQPNTSVPSEVLALVQQGKKLEVIKLYRQLTDTDLRHAQLMIESLMG